MDGIDGARKDEAIAIDADGVALCLSGGGLRAALFHLGLIRALRETEFNGAMALRSVTEVFSVSGGSILAGHFLANYEAYVGSDEDYAKVEQDLLTFVDRDLRNRVLRRWPFLMWADNPRGRLLQREYDGLLAKKTLGQCHAGKRLPKFHFLSTSFTSGALCSFSGTSFEQIDHDTGVASATQADGLPLAFAVAASSAFPPMFPPIDLPPQALATNGTPPFNTAIALSDGGVFDNFGIDKFCLTKRSSGRPGVVIVSNAGGPFATEPEHHYDGMVSRNVRASDILMRRVAEVTLQNGRTLAGDGLKLVSIGTTIEDPAIAMTTQLRFRFVRTDLDRFDRKLAALLVGHGRRVARSVLCQPAADGSAHPTFQVSQTENAGDRVGRAPSADETAALDKILIGASHRRWRALLLDTRDWLLVVVIWPLILLILAAVLGLGYLLIQRTLALNQLPIYTKAVIEKNGRILSLQAQVSGLQDQLRKTTEAVDQNSLAQARAVLARPISLPTPTPVASANLGQAADTLTGVPALPPLPGTSFKHLVFIQFAGSLTRSQIISLNQALRNAGWNVQSDSGERTTSAIGTAQVRYSGANLAAAQSLADALNQSGLPIRSVSPHLMSRVASNALEVWISD